MRMSKRKKLMFCDAFIIAFTLLNISRKHSYYMSTFISPSSPNRYDAKILSI